MTRPLFLTIVLIATAATAAAVSTPEGADEAEPLAVGRGLYERHCLKCHGPEGQGDGESAARLGLRPRDFGRGSFKCRSTTSGGLPTDADLYRSIAEGLPGTAMIRFGNKLDPAEIEAVVAYTKHLSGRFADTEPAATIEVPPAPRATRAAVAEGRQVYRVLRCWTCHGARGKGDGPAAEKLVDSWGQPIEAHDFTRRGGRFKCGGEPADLYQTLHTGISGSPMPSYTQAFPFAADGVGDLEPLAALDPKGPAEVERYLSGEPDRVALEAMSEPQRQELVERRTWALAHYLLSLVEK